MTSSDWGGVDKGNFPDTSFSRKQPSERSPSFEAPQNGCRRSLRGNYFLYVFGYNPDKNVSDF